MASGLVAKLRKQPKVRDAEALAAWIGRYQKLRKAGVPNKKATRLAGKPGGMKEGGVKGDGKDTGKSSNKGNGGVKQVADPKPIQVEGASEKQLSYYNDLVDKRKPKAPGGVKGAEEYGQKRSEKEEAVEYAVILNAPPPKDKRELSERIDDYKKSPAAYARKNPEFYKDMTGKLQKKYGNDFGGLNDAVKKRYNSLSDAEKEEVWDSGEKWRGLVLNPLLKV